MEIKVFGPGCARCKQTEAIVSQAIAETTYDVSLKKISDLKEIMAAGVMSTPALSIQGTIVCAGRVPTKSEVLAWLRDFSEGQHRG